MENNNDNILNGLNGPQQRAVETTEGPLLVLAGAGSGKTAVLTRRIANIISLHRAEPREILAITFTNKAANEMRERITQLIGPKQAKEVWAYTFHGFAVQILRRECSVLNYKDHFVIYDDSDTKRLIRQCLKDLNLDEKQYSIKMVKAVISLYKNGGSVPRYQLNDIYNLYQNKLLTSNAMDFDDLLLNLRRLFVEHPDIKEKYQKYFKYIHIDEMQDTNTVQSDIAHLLAEKHHNIMVVGDDYQCVVEGQEVMTPDGPRLIEEINIGDLVYALKGGKPYAQKITNKSVSTHNSFLQIKTNKGKVIKVTKEHSMFGKIGTHDGWYTYLLYRPDFGFRVEISKNVEYLQSEEAERIWLLKWFPTYKDAQSLKNSLSLIDGMEILDMYYQKFDNPIYFNKQSFESEDNMIVNLVMGGEIGTEVSDKKISHHFKSFKGAKFFAKQMKSLFNETIVEEFSLGKDTENLKVLPASAIIHGVLIPVQYKNSVELESVSSVEEITEKVQCYDLEVENSANFCVNGIYVHNSIYAFRNADITNILTFEQKYPEATVIKLEQNYRSTGNIIKAANDLISYNLNQKHKNLFTAGTAGEKIRLANSLDQNSEARFIISEINKLVAQGYSYKDIAIFYRTNAQSNSIENVFAFSGLPYKIVGGTKFFDRQEIKLFRCYLQLTVNPNDDMALQRVINIPARGIGEGTLKKIRDYATNNNFSLWEALNDLVKRNNPILKGKMREGVNDFISLIKLFNNIPEDNLYEEVEEILNNCGLIQYFEKEDNGVNRIENMQEFLSEVVKFIKEHHDANLTDFLEWISLRADVDDLDVEANNYVTLMTIHTSKGLEFPIVFITGVEDGLLPHITEDSSESDIEEERRLMYVAITRARERLYITRSIKRLLFGQTKLTKPSRFINELPKEIIDENKEQNNSFIDNNSYKKNNSYKFDYRSKEKSFDEVEPGYSKSFIQRDKKKLLQTFVKGDIVRHKSFGDGVVHSCDGKIVAVGFSDGNIKRLALEYAPLEKIE